MKGSNRLWRGIAAGGLSLALASGVGLPISARAAGTNPSGKTDQMMEHRQEMQAMREKMLARAKAEDAALEKMVAELNKAPEAKKADMEAAILTKLVEQHHEMLSHWEGWQTRLMQFRNERMQVGNTATSGTCTMHGMKGQTASTAQK
jgi:hypothetical protein